MLALAAVARRSGRRRRPQAGAADPAAQRRAAVVIAVLPYGTTVEQIAAVPELAPGVISAGLGAVPVAQTFLDIGQGNRVNRVALRRRPAAPLRPRRPRAGAAVGADARARRRRPGRHRSRAARRDAARTPGSRCAAEADSGLATLIGGRPRTGPSPIVAERRLRPRLRARAQRRAHRASRELRPLVAGLGPDDLLIAIERRRRAREQELLPTGIAGAGFDGNLTSDSDPHRRLRRSRPTSRRPSSSTSGSTVPDEMNGSAIAAEGERDPAAVADLAGAPRSPPEPRRRSCSLPLAIWLALTGLAALALRRARRPCGAAAARRSACAWAPADPARARRARRRRRSPRRSLIGLGAAGAGAARPAPARRPGRPRARLRGHASAPTRSTSSPARR